MSNILFCITGPSGSGKTSIMRELMDNEMLSFTTRPMRDGEINGEDYLFITKEDFDELFESGELAEWTEYGFHRYGLTMDELEDKLSKGHAFFICDNNGFNQVKEKYSNVVSIFLYADKQDCYANMDDRGDDDGRKASRISTYHEEMANRGEYDYVVKNIRGRWELTVHIIDEILAAEMSLEREAALL